MATPFSNINERFLNKISDYSFLSMSYEEFDQRLFGLMNAATPRFKRCKKDLSQKSDTAFDADLTEEEEEIISTQMVVEWLRPQINNIELLKQHLSSKDWSMYSQANHLKELRELKSDTETEAGRMMIDYSYTENSLDGLK